MTRPAHIATVAVGLMVLLAAAPSSQAADQKAVVDQIKAHNQAATTAYGSGKWEQMKSELQEAVTLANDNGFSKHAALAQTYVLLGVAEVESKNKDAGISDFVKALGISAAAEVPSKMNKKAVKAAFSKAEDQDATAATKEPAPVEPKKSDKAQKSDNKEAAADKEKDQQSEKAADKSAQAEREKQSKDLVAAKESESKAQATRDKAEKEKQNADKQLTDSKVQLAQAQKEKTDKEQELTALKANEKKEREAKEKLEKTKVDNDKQLADLRARVQQLEKDNADKDHQLAIMRDEDKKERDAKEKLEKVWQEADTREKDRKARETKEATEREKLVEGPDLPKTFPEPLHCTVPDEAAAGADLYVHCAAQPKVGAKLIVFYYRPAGVVPYNAVLMEPSKKGWFTAVIPANRLSGKFLHYYIEARDARQEVAVSNGKPSSPDVLTILPPGSAVVASQTAPSNGSLKQASATEKTRKRAKAR
ncbi:MAG TPA: hypothetical protein VH374_17195 [Polyangia bacterium]|jgi:hypothetical protein|nr:hypothetical protein [Polyangia bacterium]